MLFFLKKWKELRDIKMELALRDWFYGTKISMSMRVSQDPLTFLVNVEGKDVLLVEALVQSGITSEFLIRNLYGRGAANVKLAAFLDKQTARRVPLQPDYFGFLMSESFVVGYGLGTPDLGRNLPYIAARAEGAKA